MDSMRMPARARLRRTAMRLAAAAGLALGPVAPALAAGAPAAGPDFAQVWVSSVDRSRLLARQPDVAFTAGEPGPERIVVDAGRRYQEMEGFGAAITDASAWLIQERMSATQRESLMQELFGERGIALNLTRLTIGASDFSRRHYSLDDRPAGESDPSLAHFSIEENRADVLPVVKRALAVNPGLLVMASPWSAPGWMKTTGSLVKGTLRPAAYDAFAEYLARYIEAYAAQGVPIFAITLQNEPHFEPKDYPGMRVDAAQRARFIGEHLGPLLAKRHPGVRLLEWDHNWDEPGSPLAVLADPAARRYVAGVAWHCYAGEVGAQARVHDAHPDKETWFTECSSGEWEPLRSEALVWLTRELIIGSTRAWAKGVLFWNLALDENHGPHLGGCSDCKGVVTIDSRSGAVTRNGDYYALAHASRFVRRGARRIDSGDPLPSLAHVAFRNADDGSIAVIVANSADRARRFSIASAGRSFPYELAAKSVATFVWTPARQRPDKDSPRGR